MNPDTFCTSDQWSMIASAASTSQLAGVLGGFLITAIALLFDRSSREGVHTLALFSSAVLILMLSSFLFSLIGGTHPPDSGDRQGICVIAWTQGNLATGMLAAGTTALFGGLGWMLASHAVNKVPSQDPADIRAYCFLADLGGWLTFGAAMATTLIMSETSIDYLYFVLGHRPALWLTGTIVTLRAGHPARFRRGLHPHEKPEPLAGQHRRANAVGVAVDQGRHGGNAVPRGRRVMARRQPRALTHRLADHPQPRVRHVRLRALASRADDHFDRGLLLGRQHRRGSRPTLLLAAPRGFRPPPHTPC
jgi:hypothetical protein